VKTAVGLAGVIAEGLGPSAGGGVQSLRLRDVVGRASRGVKLDRSMNVGFRLVRLAVGEEVLGGAEPPEPRSGTTNP